MWILIGVLFGSTLTSIHDTREACEGRAVLLREKGASIKCVDNQPARGTFTITPNITICGSTTCNN